MEETIKILFLEDVDSDAELNNMRLKEAGFNISSKRVQTREDFIRELDNFIPDLILADYSLPSFNGIEALNIVMEKKNDIPFIFVTGTMGEVIAVEAIKMGATDYVLKNNLERLVPSVNRALHESEVSKMKNSAEQALKESEKHYHHLFDSLPYGAEILDTNGTIIKCNLETAKMLGYEIDEILEKHITNFFDSDTVKLFKQNFPKLLNGEHVSLEVCMLHKNGNTINVIRVGQPIANTDGEIEAVLAINIDITERKQAEEKLRKSEERFHSMFEKHDAMMLLLEPETGVILDANQAAERFYGYSKSQFKKMNIDYINALSPKQVTVEMQKALHEKKNYFEFLHRLANGQERFVEVHSSPIEFHEKKILYSIIYDITEHKRAEEEIRNKEVRYRELVNAINSGVAVYKVINDGKSGSDYIIKDFNKTALKLENLGINEVLGKSLLDIRPNIDAYGLIPICQKVWKTGEPAFFPAKEYVDDKYSNYYENRIFRLPNGNIVAVFDDVTVRENSLLELRKNQERLDLALNATKDGIFDWNLITNEVYYSPPWKSMLGYKENELSNDISVWKTLTEPEYQKKSGELLDELINMKRDRYKLEFKMKHKDGHWVDILSRAKAIFDESGKAVRVIGTNIDISEHKQVEKALHKSEEKLRLALEGAVADCWEMNMFTGELFYGDQWARHLGYERGEIPYTIEGTTNILHPDDVLNNQKELEAYFNGEKEIYETVTRIRKKDGTYAWLLSRGKTVERDKNGNPVRLIGTNIDITDRKRAEEEIQSQLAELKQWHQVTVNRENRVIDLKKEVNELHKRIGEPVKYSEINFEDTQTGEIENE